MSGWPLDRRTLPPHDSPLEAIVGSPDDLLNWSPGQPLAPATRWPGVVMLVSFDAAGALGAGLGVNAGHSGDSGACGASCTGTSNNT